MKAVIYFNFLFYIFWSIDVTVHAEKLAEVNLQSGATSFIGKCFKPYEQQHVFHSCVGKFPSSTTACTCTYNCYRKLQLNCYNGIWYGHRETFDWEFSSCPGAIAGLINYSGQQPNLIVYIKNGNYNFLCENGYKLIGSNKLSLSYNCEGKSFTSRCISENYFTIQCENAYNNYKNNELLSCENIIIEDGSKNASFIQCKCKSNCLDIKLNCTSYNETNIKATCNKENETFNDGDFKITFSKQSINSSIYYYSCLNNLTLNGNETRICKNGNLTGQEPFCALNSVKTIEMRNKTLKENLNPRDNTAFIVTTSFMCIFIITTIISTSLLLYKKIMHYKKAKRQQNNNHNIGDQNYPDYEYIDMDRIAGQSQNTNGPIPSQVQPINESENLYEEIKVDSNEPMSEKRNIEVTECNDLYGRISIDCHETAVAHKNSEVTECNSMYDAF